MSKAGCQSACGCGKVKKVAERLGAKLDSFKTLADQFQTSLNVLREAVKYLPVPPSPMVIQPTTEPMPEVPVPQQPPVLNTTIDLLSEEEGETLPSPCRRRKAQNTSEIVISPEDPHGPKRSRDQEIQASTRKSPASCQNQAKDSEHLDNGLFRTIQTKEVKTLEPRATKSNPNSQDLETNRQNQTNKIPIAGPSSVCSKSSTKVVSKSNPNGSSLSLCTDCVKKGKSVCNHNHACPICSKKFKYSYSLKRHEPVHNRILVPQDHVCPVCSKKFDAKYKLKQHDDRAHKKIRPHICSVCSQGFSDKHVLLKHEQTHDKNRLRSHFCSFCRKGFFSKPELKKHENSHINKARDQHYCPLCSLPFLTKRDLNRHRETCGRDNSKNNNREIQGVQFQTEKSKNVNEEVEVNQFQLEIPATCGRDKSKTNSKEIQIVQFQTEKAKSVNEEAEVNQFQPEIPENNDEEVEIFQTSETVGNYEEEVPEALSPPTSPSLLQDYYY